MTNTNNASLLISFIKQHLTDDDGYFAYQFHITENDIIVSEDDSEFKFDDEETTQRLATLTNNFMSDCTPHRSWDIGNFTISYENGDERVSVSGEVMDWKEVAIV